MGPFTQQRFLGGALAFYDKSVMIIHGNRTRIDFIENHATKYGGAIYVDDATYITRLEDYTYTMKEFILQPGLCLKHPAPFFFLNNTAELAGNIVFGGRVAEALQFPVNTKEDPSNIASEPTRVCPCENLIPNCNLTLVPVKHYPRQRYVFEAVAIGQKLGTVSSIIQAKVVHASNSATDHDVNDTGELEDTEYTQLTRKSCTKLMYTLKSLPGVHLNVTLRNINYDSEKWRF